MFLLSFFIPILWFAGGPNPVKGDIFVIVGSTLYAVSNVGEVCISCFPSLLRKLFFSRFIKAS